MTCSKSTIEKLEKGKIDVQSQQQSHWNNVNDKHISHLFLNFEHISQLFPLLSVEFEQISVSWGHTCFKYIGYIWQNTNSTVILI